MPPETLENALKIFDESGDFQPVRQTLRKFETNRKSRTGNLQANARALSLCLRMGDEDQDVVLLNTTLKLLDMLQLTAEDQRDISGKAVAVISRLKL